jgi:hypothetical protein
MYAVSKESSSGSVSSLRKDILVDKEEIGRTVFLYDLSQAWEIIAVSGLYPILTIFHRMRPAACLPPVL